MTEPTDGEPPFLAVNPEGEGAGAALFPLGKVLMTPGALIALTESGADLSALLKRHQSGDWGDLDAHDRKVNLEALRNGHRLLSAYTLPGTHAPHGCGQTLWIITEADRTATTALTPQEY